jgi:hypothetical protein
VLLNFLDALSFHKQNALIWGVGIDQSFVVESAAFPNISSHASFGPPGTHVYSRDTVRFLVAEANFRGIRMLPYIELVGHDPLNMPGLQFCNGAPQAGGLFHPLHAGTWTCEAPAPAPAPAPARSLTASRRRSARHACAQSSMPFGRTYGKFSRKTMCSWAATRWISRAGLMIPRSRPGTSPMATRLVT